MYSDVTNNKLLQLNMVFPPYFQKCKTVVLMHLQDKKIRSCHLDQFVGGEMTAEIQARLTWVLITSSDSLCDF